MKPAEFFHWWGNELADLIPAQARARLGRNRCVLVLTTLSGSARVHAQVEGETLEFGVVPFNPTEDQRHTLRAFVLGLSQRPDRIEVHLPPGRYITRDVDLPLAAEANLREAIGFQIDRLTPFTADQVTYFCGVKERLPNDKRLRAWLTVTPSDPLTKTLDLVSDLQPVPGRPPRQGTPPDQALVLSYRPKTAVQAGRSPVTWGLVGLNLALLAGGIYLHVQNRLELRDRTLAELRLVQSQARQASDLQDRIESIRAQAQALYTRRTARPLVVELLEDLTARLDDHTWLQRLETKNGRLKLQGVSDAASTLIGKLEGSDMLSDVRFDASITRDNRSGGERFSVSGRIIKPAETFVPAPVDLEEVTELADGAKSQYLPGGLNPREAITQ